MIEQEDVEGLRTRVISRAEADLEFRKRLLADARSALRELGIEVPPGFKVTVLESSATSHYLVLPPADGDELSDEDLEAVAGGACWNFLRRNKKPQTDATDVGGSGHGGEYIPGYDDNALNPNRILDDFKDSSDTESDIADGDNVLVDGFNQLDVVRKETVMKRIDSLSEDEQSQLAGHFDGMDRERASTILKAFAEDENIKSYEEMSDAINQYKAGDRPIAVEDHDPTSVDIVMFDARSGFTHDQMDTLRLRQTFLGEEDGAFYQRLDQVPPEHRETVIRAYYKDILDNPQRDVSLQDALGFIERVDPSRRR